MLRGLYSKSVLKRIILLGSFLPFIALAYTSPGKPAGFVNDFAEVLSPLQKNELEAKLFDFNKGTGNEISIVTIKSLGGDTVENFAIEIFEEWGIGEKGKDNGVLFLVAINEREMRIEVGYGLEGALTDAQSYWIEQNVAVPAFRDRNYYAGISGVTDKIMGVIARTEDIPSFTQNQPVNSRSFSNLFFLIFFVPIWLASILGRSKSWWIGGVLGGISGVVLGFIYGFLYIGLIAVLGLIPIGLFFDFLVSRAYAKGKLTGHYPWWIGGGGRWGGGGGFGGFGGGSSGGGGSSSRW